MRRNLPIFRCVRADLATLQVDAIVNSALLGGGGVDGAIHRAVGPELGHERRLLGGCKIEQAKITRGYCLPAKHIIHTVGPVWRGGNDGEPELLASCYRRSIELAGRHGVVTLAFPAISTGVHGYPIEAATEIAVTTVRDAVREHANIREVTFCCFSAGDLAIYERLLSAST